MGHKIKFVNSDIEEMEIGENLSPSEVMNSENSPVLFGCRTGICGTCLINVVEGYESLSPPDEEEKEVLEIVAPNYPHARLACQINIKGEIKIEYLGK